MRYGRLTEACDYSTDFTKEAILGEIKVKVLGMVRTESYGDLYLVNSDSPSGEHSADVSMFLDAPWYSYTGYDLRHYRHREDILWLPPHEITMTPETNSEAKDTLERWDD